MALKDFDKISQEFADGADQAEVARKFDSIAKQAPDAWHSRNQVIELAAFLTDMSKQQRPEPKQANVVDATKTLDAQIDQLVWNLRDLAKPAFGIPGKVRVIADASKISVDPNNPALKLFRLAQTPEHRDRVVERLIAMLEDRRPTRSWAGPMNGGHFYRNADVALEILDHVACEERPYSEILHFYRNDSLRDAYFTTTDEDTRQEIVSRVKRWWREKLAENVDHSIRVEGQHQPAGMIKGKVDGKFGPYTVQLVWKKKLWEKHLGKLPHIVVKSGETFAFTNAPVKEAKVIATSITNQGKQGKTEPSVLSTTIVEVNEPPMAIADPMTQLEEAQNTYLAKASFTALSPRDTVTQFLEQLAKGRKSTDGNRANWDHAQAYTTGDDWWTAELVKLVKNKAFRPIASLGTADRMMVLACITRKHIYAGEFPKVGLFDLVKKNDRWLIENTGAYRSETAWHMADGFARNDDVRWEVTRDDIIGNFGDMMCTSWSFLADGTWKNSKGGIAGSEGKWHLQGDVLVSESDGKLTRSRIVNFANGGFSVDRFPVSNALKTEVADKWRKELSGIGKFEMTFSRTPYSPPKVENAGDKSVNAPNFSSPNTQNVNADPPVSETASAPRKSTSDVVGHLYNAPITGAQLKKKSIRSIILPRLIDEYKKKHAKQIEPTEEEIAQFAKYFEADRQKLIKSQKAELESSLAKLQSKLSADDLADDERVKLEIEISSIEARLHPNVRMIAEMILKKWKYEKHLYDHFGGGRIMFQQAGLEAFDATYRWLLDEENRGVFKIEDAKLRDQLFHYWTSQDDSPFVSGDPNKVADYFEYPPWAIKQKSKDDSETGPSNKSQDQPDNSKRDEPESDIPRELVIDISANGDVSIDGMEIDTKYLTKLVKNLLDDHKDSIRVLIKSHSDTKYEFVLKTLDVVKNVPDIDSNRVNVSLSVREPEELASKLSKRLSDISLSTIAEQVVDAREIWPKGQPLIKFVTDAFPELNLFVRKCQCPTFSNRSKRPVRRLSPTKSPRTNSLLGKFVTLVFTRYLKTENSGSSVVRTTKSVA